MGSDFVDLLSREIKDLELRLSHLRRLRALYEGAKPPGRPSKHAETIEAAKAIIRSERRIFRTTEILAKLEASGFSIPGKSRRNTLSAMLHNAGLMANGRAGWTMPPSPTPASPTPTPTTTDRNPDDR